MKTGNTGFPASVICFLLVISGTPAKAVDDVDGHAAVTAVRDLWQIIRLKISSMVFMVHCPSHLCVSVCATYVKVEFKGKVYFL